MPKFQFLILLFFLPIHVEIRKGVSLSEMNSVKTGEIDATAKWVPPVKSGKCREIAGEEEMMMDSESNRRVLMMQRRYISYDTLRRDMVPCNRPGASYYNCRGPGFANSYNRGCEIITRCARGD